MILNAITTRFLSSKTLAVLEHTMIEGKTVIFGLMLQQRGEEVEPTITLQEESITNLPTSFQHKPVHIVVTDTQVLTKTVTSTGTDAQILAQAYPNFNETEFYYQILKTNTQSFVAICRKQHIENLCTQYQQQGIHLHSISLGNLDITAVVPYLKTSHIYTQTAHIDVANGDLITLDAVSLKQGSPETYTLEGFSIPNTHVLALAVGIARYTKSEAVTGNTVPKNIELYTRSKEKRFFNAALRYGIGGLFLILFVNFFVFSSAYSKWQQLQEEVQLYAHQKKQIQQQQEQLKAKETMVKSIQASGFSKSSYYIDQMISRLPSTVTLQSLTYQPLAKRIRANQPISYQNQIIALTGVTKDKVAFTQWLQELETLDVFKTVTILQYGVDTKNNTTFEVRLTIASHDTTH